MRSVIPGMLLVLVMAQPNMATGIMPFYRERWHLQPLIITIVFAAYLFALVPTMSTIGRPPGRRGWWWRIGLGCAFSIGADSVMALAHSAWIACLARIAAGISVGLVTGSAAGLILERLGERGRTALATATVSGSALGTMAAAMFGQYLPAPAVTVYVIHALLLAGLAIGVWATRAELPRRADMHAESVVDSPEPTSVGYLCGISAWVSAGIVTALFPSYGAALLATDNLALLALPVTVYLASAWLAQRLITPAKVPAEPVLAQVIIIVGVLIAASVPVLPHLAVLIVAGILAGAGQGVAYRCGLRIVSSTGQPGTHARAASRYAAVAYLCAAISIVGLGVIANRASMSVSVLAAAFLLAVVAAITVVCHLRGARSSKPTARVTQPA